MDAMMMDQMAKDMAGMPGMADTDLDMQVMQACMDACAACEQACTMCATQGMDCASTSMNCADMCNTMMRTMMRMQGMTPATLMAMLDACIAICALCEDECRPHEDSAMCQICAQACRACMDACTDMKTSLAG